MEAFVVWFVCEQRKRRSTSRVSDDYEDIDEAEDTKNVYQGLYKLSSGFPLVLISP